MLVASDSEGQKQPPAETRLKIRNFGVTWGPLKKRAVFRKTASGGPVAFSGVFKDFS